MFCRNANKMRAFASANRGWQECSGCCCALLFSIIVFVHVFCYGLGDVCVLPKPCVLSVFCYNGDSPIITVQWVLLDDKNWLLRWRWRYDRHIGLFAIWTSMSCNVTCVGNGCNVSASICVVAIADQKTALDIPSLGTIYINLSRRFAHLRLPLLFEILFFAAVVPCLCRPHELSHAERIESTNTYQIQFIYAFGSKHFHFETVYV